MRLCKRLFKRLWKRFCQSGFLSHGELRGRLQRLIQFRSYVRSYSGFMRGHDKVQSIIIGLLRPHGNDSKFLSIDPA